MTGKHSVTKRGSHRQHSQFWSTWDNIFDWPSRFLEALQASRHTKVLTLSEEEEIEFARRERFRVMHERHAERLAEYDVVGTQAYLDELDDWLVDRTHEDMTPPWEED